MAENNTKHVKKMFSALCQKLGTSNGIRAMDNNTKTIGVINNGTSDTVE